MMVKKGSGAIKQILKGHLLGSWQLHDNQFPESYRNNIKETVEKMIRCEGSSMPNCLFYL